MSNEAKEANEALNRAAGKDAGKAGGDEPRPADLDRDDLGSGDIDTAGKGAMISGDGFASETEAAIERSTAVQGERES